MRFAPSPTGALHTGGARTALFNYLWRLKLGGRLIFRIEDTDPAREVSGAAEQMLQDLEWLGIRFDEGESIGGDFAPYRQSQRHHFHAAAVERLIENGSAYRCWCKPERLLELRKANAAAGQPPRYDHHCRDLPESERQHLTESGAPSVVRLRTPPVRQTIIPDLLKGTIEFDSRALDDPILVRSDGTATGLLAGAADDHAMGVTHILRGEEWLPSTPYQMLVFEGLGGSIPRWGHLSLLVDVSRAKLSKRTPGMTIAELRRDGVLPETICRYLAGLGRGTMSPERGWTLDDLSQAFEPSDYRSGEIVFSMNALLGLNSRFLRRLTPAELQSRLAAWDESGKVGKWESGKVKPGYPTLALCHFTTLPLTAQELALRLAAEMAPTTLAHLRDELLALTGDAAADKASLAEHPRCRELLECLRDALDRVGWEETAIGEMLSGLGDRLGLHGRELFSPIRLSLSGRRHGPKLASLLLLYGRDESRRRTEAALRRLKDEE